MAPSSAADTGSSRSTSPARAGSNTTRWTSSAAPSRPGGEAIAAGRRAPCRARHHQPARDGPALGPEDARAARAGHRLAGSPDRRPLRRAPRAGPRPRCCGRRPASCRTPTSPRRSSSCCWRDAGGAAPGGTRGARRGHGGQLARRAAHRRRGARHRPHQRLAHHALRPRVADLGSGTARPSSAFRAALLPRSCHPAR